jgi:hypothetical protein
MARNHSLTLPHYRAPAGAGAERGLWAENIFFQAAALLNDDCVGERMPKPEWLTWIDRASTFEDMRDGIDAVARTSRGDIPIQIKSSQGGARHHLAKHPGWEGLTLIISDRELTAEDVAEATIYALHPLWCDRPADDDS